MFSADEYSYFPYPVSVIYATLATFGEVSDEIFVKLTTFPFPCICMTMVFFSVSALTAGAIVGIIFGVIAIIFLVIAITVIALDRLGVISIPLLKKKEDTSKLVASGFENDNYHGGDKGSEA